MVVARLLAVVTIFVAGIAFAASLPDIVRYLRMRSM